MISEFWPKNIMISDFGAKKYQITEWHILMVSEFDRKKVIPHRFYSKPLLNTDFWG